MRKYNLPHVFTFLLPSLGMLIFPAMAEAADPGFTISPPILKLQEGANPPPITLFIEGVNLSGIPAPQPAAGQGAAVTDPKEAAKPQLSIRDVGGEGPADIAVEFSQPEELPGQGQDHRNWRTSVAVKNLDPASQIQRKASLSLGDWGEIVSYTLDNTTSGSFSFSLVPPPQDLVLEQTRRTALAVTTGDRPATGVRIVQSTLQDTGSKALLGTDQLELKGGDRVAKGTTKELALEVKDSFTTPGEFTGSLTLATDQQSATQAVSLTVYSSSSKRRLLGCGLIILGILISWGVTYFARNRLARLKALESASLLAVRLPDLEAILREAQPKQKMPKVEKMITDLKKDLSDSSLDKYLPSWVPAAIGGDETRATKLTEHLTAAAGRLAILEEILRRGVFRVLSRWDGSGPQPFEDALTKLDDLADPTADLATLKTKVDGILATLPAPKSRSGTSSQSPEARHREIQAGIDFIQGGVWLVWGILTFATGAIALVLTNPGFGTMTELAVCFLWGLGIQTAGQQLQQMSPQTITTQFKLKVPA